VALDGILAEASPKAPFLMFGGIRFPDAAWDPALRAQVVLADFGACAWKDTVPGDFPAEHSAETRAEIEVLLQMRALRPARLPEIVMQASNIQLYWHDMLMVGLHGRPNTSTVIEIAMAVGHMVGMYWKFHFKRARPVQVFPALMPVVMTPSHPSYPSNHSFQSHLIAHALGSAFTGDAHHPMRAMLFALAARIGRNREIAGVHFPSDTDLGKKLAVEIFGHLERLPSFQAIRDGAKQEWAGLRPGVRPNYVGPGMTLIDQIAERVVERLKQTPDKPPRGTK
jgi:acid phosphatase (class A)